MKLITADAVVGKIRGVLELACIAHEFSTARVHRMDIHRKLENSDLAVVHHSVARDSPISYVYPSALPSRYENP